jgi:hypothetical protein
MRNVIDLISLYISINQQVVDTKKDKRSGRFNDFHQTLLNIKDCLDKIRVDMNMPSSAPIAENQPDILESSIWEYFGLLAKIQANKETLSSLNS